MTFHKREERVQRPDGSALVRSAELVGGLLGKLGRCFGDAQSFFGSRDRETETSGRAADWKALPAVHPSDEWRAIQALQEAGRVDVQRYLKAIDPVHLMAEPLGPRADCLSVDDLGSEVLADDVRIKAHVLVCDDCAEAERAYQLVQRQSLGIQPKATWSAIGIEFPTGMVLDDYVDFDVKVYAPPGVAIVPESLTMDGIVEQVRCQPLHLVQEDPLLGSSYVARCRGRARRELIDPSSVDAVSDFADWIIVSGLTTTGEPFSRKVLVRLSGGPAVQR